MSSISESGHSYLAPVYSDEGYANPFDVPNEPEEFTLAVTSNYFKPAPTFVQKAVKWIKGDHALPPPQDYAAIKEQVEKDLGPLAAPALPLEEKSAMPALVNTSWISLLTRFFSERLWGAKKPATPQTAPTVEASLSRSESATPPASSESDSDIISSDGEEYVLVSQQEQWERDFLAHFD